MSDKIFLKDSDGKETAEWVSFKDYQKMPARLFMRFAKVSQNFNDYGDELFDILGRYVDEWHLVSEDTNLVIPIPKESEQWKDEVSFNQLFGIIQAFGSLFPGADGGRG